MFDPSGLLSGAAVDEDVVLMAAPAALVAHIEERAVVMCLPPGAGGLRVSRGVYEIYRLFHLPRLVGDVLTAEPDRRAKRLEVVRFLTSKRYLVPPEVGIPGLAEDADEHGG